MTNKRLMASLLLGGTLLAATSLPAPALARGSAAQNAALDQMAMQIYVQQQAAQQQQTLLLQQQAAADKAAYEANLAARQNVAYYAPAWSYYSPAPIAYRAERFIEHLGRDLHGRHAFRRF